MNPASTGLPEAKQWVRSDHQYEGTSLADHFASSVPDKSPRHLQPDSISLISCSEIASRSHGNPAAFDDVFGQVVGAAKSIRGVSIARDKPTDMTEISITKTRRRNVQPKRKRRGTCLCFCHSGRPHLCKPPNRRVWEVGRDGGRITILVEMRLFVISNTMRRVLILLLVILLSTYGLHILDPSGPDVIEVSATSATPLTSESRTDGRVANQTVGPFDSLVR